MCGRDGDRAGAALFNSPGKLTNVAYCADGKAVAATSEGPNPRLRVWDVDTGEELASLAGHTDDVAGLALHPAGHLAATGSHDGTVRVWDLTSQAVWTFDGRALGGRVDDVVFTPEGRYLVVGNSNGCVSVLRTPTPTESAPGPPVAHPEGE